MDDSSHIWTKFPKKHLLAAMNMNELILDPGNPQTWEVAGQQKLLQSDGLTAARYFTRALSSTNEHIASDIFLKLGLSLEMAGDFSMAADNYIKHFKMCQSTGEFNKKSLYRALGCFHKLNDFKSITKYSNKLNPNDWNDSPGIHEIIGYSNFHQENFLSAIIWILSAPLQRDFDKEYQNLFNFILDNTPNSYNNFDPKYILTCASKQIFNSHKRAKSILRWLSLRKSIETLRYSLSSLELILASEGNCIPYILSLEGQHGTKGRVQHRARQCLILNPEHIPAYAHILPGEEDLPSDSPAEFWVERWAKATLITSTSDPAIINKAVISLKSAENSDIKNCYLIRAANLFPSFPVIQYNVGSYLNECALAESAEPILRRALIYIPDYAKAWSAYSVSHCIMLQPQEAIDASKRSINSNPDLASGYTNLAMSYRGAGDIPNAIVASKVALKKNPSNAVTRMGLAFNQLSDGAIEQGFENYLSRWQQKGFPSRKRPFPQREWVNNKLAKHEKFLVYMEQGMGDELMFSWFLLLLDEKYPNQIILECDERLVNLFQRSFPRVEVLPRTAPIQSRLFEPDVRWKLPIAHLPHFFTSKIRALIKERWSLPLQPYISGYGWLTLNPTRVQFWRKYLEKLSNGDKRLVVGVAWRSANLARARALQYVSPDELVRSLPDGALAINLQYVYDDSEIEIIEAGCKKRDIIFHTIPDLDLRDDLDEIMNLCGALDALACPLTSTAFMGGSLGVPTFVFRSAPSSEIWQQLGTPHLPWLPSIRVFFRDPRDDWGDVLDMVRDRLTLLAKEHTIVAK